MSRGSINLDYLDDIANAIRAKNGSSDEYTPAQMATAIGNIPGGITPTGTINITENGTVDVTQYASANVSVSGGGGVTLLTKAQWDALSGAQKREYGLVAIQDSNTGFDRGELVYGADYIGLILQQGTAASSATFAASVTGSYTMLVIAMNGEASTWDLNISASLNNTALTGTTLSYHQYSGSGNNRRNYRINAYDITVEAGDTISIELTEGGSYASFVYAITDANITDLVQEYSTADAVCSGSYSSNAAVLQGIFNGSSGGTINLQAYTANETIQTENPGNYYKSAYIFWFE